MRFHGSSPRSLIAALLGWLVMPVAVGQAREGASVAVANRGLVGDGIAMFVPQGYRSSATPSLSIVAATDNLRPMPQDWALVPEFFTLLGRAAASLDVPAGSSLYGTGEVTGPLLRNGRSITLWNTDNYAYLRDGGRRLYQSHPWVLGVRPDGTAFGILFETTWKAELETRSDQIVIRTEGAPFRVAVIDRESPQAVVRGLAELTGTMPMPPKWALGFHQCRYSYYPDSKVREIADEFRKRKLPCDVIWMDIHYMDGFRVFTFDPKHFPDPKATNDYLHAKGFHSVWMIDPGVKAERGYSVYDSGSRRGIWVQTKDGREFQGKVWPGVCAFPDFTMPAAREWWAGLYRDFIATGIDGVWNDMNEPAVFETPDLTMPEDNVHRGGDGLPPGPHRLYHNAYGMLMARATREGILAARPDKRPFVLTRGNHLGGQRYAATWTGDNGAAIEFLKMSVPMSLNLGLSGQPLSGPDIGGYSGTITPELFGKWIAMAPFYPFSRAHTAVDNPAREPWVFGPEIEKVAKTALERRYRFLPYLYTLSHRAYTSGDPIMQPVFFADPKDPKLREEEEAFLLGPDVLVIPAWSEAPGLPGGIWRSLSIPEETEADGYQASMKLRGGAILPMGPVIQHTGERSPDPITLVVSLDGEGKAEGTLYEDAGDGFGYQKGEYALTRYTAVSEGASVMIRIADRSGNMKIPARTLRVRILSDGGIIEETGLESGGIAIPLSGRKPTLH